MPRKRRQHLRPRWPRSPSSRRRAAGPARAVRARRPCEPRRRARWHRPRRPPRTRRSCGPSRPPARCPTSATAPPAPPPSRTSPAARTAVSSSGAAPLGAGEDHRPQRLRQQAHRGRRSIRRRRRGMRARCRRARAPSAGTADPGPETGRPTRGGRAPRLPRCDAPGVSRRAAMPPVPRARSAALVPSDAQALREVRAAGVGGEAQVGQPVTAACANSACQRCAPARPAPRRRAPTAPGCAAAWRAPCCSREGGAALPRGSRARWCR